MAGVDKGDNLPVLSDNMSRGTSRNGHQRDGIGYRILLSLKAVFSTLLSPCIPILTR